MQRETSILKSSNWTILFQILAGTFIPEAVAGKGSVEKVWPATLLKGGSGAGVFLWILQDF